MRKLLLSLSLLLISTPAFCGTISIPQFISGNDVTVAALESQRSTLQNVINGNIEGGINIKAGSIVSQDLANSISPIIRWGESFNNFTYTGMLPVTDATLSSNISAGTSYVNGYRVVTSSTAHTYTASKDTYVYIHQGGYFVFQEVSNGASAPSTPSNTLLLAKVVTSGTAITSVTDSRTTSVQITVTSSNFPTNYRDQAFVSRDTTTNFYVYPGSVAIGLSNYVNTANTTTRTITTAGNWIEGNYPGGYKGLVFVYAYNNSGSSFDFKFSSADVAYSDTSSNSAGVLRYYTSGGVTYRAIGWAYLSADTVQTYEAANLHDVGTANQISYTSLSAASTASTSFVNDTAVPLLYFYSSGGNVNIIYNGGVDDGGSSQCILGIMIDNVDILSTPRSQLTSSGTTNIYSTVCEWHGILGRGIHSVQARFKAASSTAYINARSVYIRED